MDLADFPIGVLDSGIGGLTVLQSIVKILPCEHFLYLADSQRLPYGDKDRADLVQYALEGASFLKDKKIKALVIACHTLSAQALDIIQNTFQIPVIGAVQGGVDILKTFSQLQKLGILATQSTIHSGVYQFLLRSHLPHCEIYPIACPLLVPQIEEISGTNEEIERIIEGYIAPLKKEKVDAVFLGCTHYPLITPLFKKLLGEKISLIDPSDIIAWRLKELLGKNELLSKKSTHRQDFFVTSSPDQFALKARVFLKMEIAPSLVKIAR